MISLKSKHEIETMQEAANVLRKVFEAIDKAVKPGITTDALDKIAEDTIRNQGAEPAFLGYRGYPKTACVSVNEEVVHGIPGNRILNEGDLVSVDIGARKNGYFSDAARTWAVGKIQEESRHLMETARGAFDAGVAAYRPGARIGDLSAAIQQYIEAQGFQVVRDYVGHGIGRQIHEEPQVPNYGQAGAGPKIQEGLVLAIEPMVTEGSCRVKTLEDGWTVVTQDGKRASHYEDTVAFIDGRCMNLTRGI